jgi:N-acetylmuramoyl-L-alanine amidase
LKHVIDVLLAIAAIAFLALALALLLRLVSPVRAVSANRPDTCQLILDMTPEAPRKLAPSDLADLSRTIWAEARSETLCGQIAVGFVALNRSTHDPATWGSTVSAVVRKKDQFTPWAGKASRARLMALNVSDPSYLTATLAASLVLSGAVQDPTQGAMWFHTLTMVPPRWARHAGKPLVIGQHLFYGRRN